MKLIVGLGNIGEKYCFTRHNIGFMVVDKLAVSKGLTFKEDKKLKSLITKYKYNGEDIILVKPTTFMNLSGEAVNAVLNYYKISKEDLLIIYDDISLDLGRLRFKNNGSDGGHNGIKSIINHLKSQKFDRLKLGIGPQPPIPLENYVLQNFSKEQLEILKPMLLRSVESLEYFLVNGIEKTQNIFN